MSDETGLKAIEAALSAHEQKLETAIKKYEGQLKDAGSVASEARDEVKKLAEDFQRQANIVRDLAQKGGAALGDKAKVKSIGQEFCESEQFKSFLEGRTGKARVEVKNTIIGQEGSPPANSDTIVPRETMQGIVPGAFRMINVLDVIPMGMTASNQIHYTRELSWTNDAAETNEGDLKPESDLTFEAVDTPVRTIAHFLKVSKQVLEDAPALQSYIDRRLRHGVLQRAQAQVINGNGTPPNLSGLLDAGNFTAFTAQTGEDGFASLNRAKYQVIAADYMPDVVLLNPAQFGEMERLRTSGGGDGQFLAAQALTYLQSGLMPLLWGIPVVLSNSVPANKFIMFARDATMFWQRSGVIVEAFEQDGDNVQRNLVTIRAEMRGAFTVFRPAAVVGGSLVAT